MKRTNILLAADRDLIRRSLHDPLASEGGWHICGESSTGPEAVKMAAKFHPEIVVLDAELPGLGGVEAAAQIKAARPETEVLILTDDENDALIRQVLSIGARGYLLKDEAGEKILPALKALCKHRQYLRSPAARVAFENYLKAEMVKAGPTPRRSIPR